MTCFCDVPPVCISTIATLLECDDLLSLSLTCRYVDTVIKSNREYIQQIRIFETYTSNPYRHCFINNTCDQKSHQPTINPLDILEEVKDMCELNDVMVEELHTHQISRGFFQYRLDNGKNGYYITDIHIKAEFNCKWGHIWLIYGNNALRAEFGSQLMNLISQDPDDYYHLYNEFLLLVPKLVKGFDDPSDYLFLELGSSGLATIRVIRHRVDMTKASKWNARMGYGDKKVLISMPRVREYSFYGTRSSQALYQLKFVMAFGQTVAICVDIRMASTGLSIDPSFVEYFRVGYVTAAGKGCKKVGEVHIDASLTHCSFIQNYRKAVRWPFFFKDCFLIPFNTTYNIDGTLYVDIKLKSDMDTITNAFNLKYYKHIYFD